MNDLKQCTKCGEGKPRVEFYKHPSTADRLGPKCKKCDNDRSREATDNKINRTRARHRAIADLISFHQEEFDALYAIRQAEAIEEAEALAADPAGQDHYRGEPIRLKPGKRMHGQTVRDRIDVARCPHCVTHHDRGHVCPSCGAVPDSARVISNEEKLEDLEYLNGALIGATEAAERGGFISPQAMERWLYRKGRGDLWLALKHRDPAGTHSRESA